jgi:hypothetical protein
MRSNMTAPEYGSSRFVASSQEGRSAAAASEVIAVLLRPPIISSSPWWSSKTLPFPFASPDWRCGKFTGLGFFSSSYGSIARVSSIAPSLYWSQTRFFSKSYRQIWCRRVCNECHFVFTRQGLAHTYPYCIYPLAGFACQGAWFGLALPAWVG